jgi:hypothetical protein
MGSPSVGPMGGAHPVGTCASDAVGFGLGVGGNDSSGWSHVFISGHTFAPTPGMIDLRLQVALAAQRGLKLYHADVSNAFAKAARLEQTYYMRIDAPFCEWWNARFPTQTRLPGQAIPILKNLQEHREAPRLWSIHINNILV